MFGLGLWLHSSTPSQSDRDGSQEHSLGGLASLCLWWQAPSPSSCEEVLATEVKGIFQENARSIWTWGDSQIYTGKKGRLCLSEKVRRLKPKGHKAESTHCDSSLEAFPNNSLLNKTGTWFFLSCFCVWFKIARSLLENTLLISVATWDKSHCP